MTPWRSVPDRFWAKVLRGPGCWEWTGNRSYQNYGRLLIVGTMRKAFAHRVSWEIHHGPIPDGMFVCHRCDNPPCVRPDHLFLGTHQDNMDDRTAKGRHVAVSMPGETNPSAKLSLEQVREIRRTATRRRGEQMAMARAYGVSGVLIGKVIRQEIWRDV